LEFGNKIVALLAAVPVPARQSWYFVDLLRLSTSPPGSTELLVLEAIRLLKDSGAQEATLGFSPLSNMHLAPQGENERLYRCLRFLSERVSFFYRFKPLFKFKSKFQPTHYEPMYLIFSPPKIGLKEILSLMDALLPG